MRASVQDDRWRLICELQLYFFIYIHVCKQRRVDSIWMGIKKSKGSMWLGQHFRRLSIWLGLFYSKARYMNEVGFEILVRTLIQLLFPLLPHPITHPSCTSTVSYMAFVLLLFVSHLSFFWCLGKAVLRDCGISLDILIFNVYLVFMQYQPL